MKRAYVLGVIVLSGALAAAAAQLGAQAPAAPGGAPGQGGPGRGAPAGRGAAAPISPIEKVANNLYMIQQQGGNTAVYGRPDQPGRGVVRFGDLEQCPVAKRGNVLGPNTGAVSGRLPARDREG